jgi:deoxyribonuclease-4
MSTKSLLGAHLSIAGGFWKAIERAHQIGATCVQIFTKSNRQWRAKTITNEDAEKFLDAQKEFKVDTIVAHASYLINLASEKKDVQEKSIKALADEISRCQYLNIPYLVLHPGSNSSEVVSKSCQQIGKNINTAFEITPPQKTMILLETMAGQGSTIGKRFEDLAEIIKSVSSKKNIGVCIDTCHIFAAGYEFDNKKNYEKLWKTFDEIIGLEKIKVIHINDSKKDFASCIDRHEHISKGKIKTDSFKLLMNDKKFKYIAKIIETPKSSDDLKYDQKNLDTLKSYIKK